MASSPSTTTMRTRTTSTASSTASASSTRTATATATATGMKESVYEEMELAIQTNDMDSFRALLSSSSTIVNVLNFQQYKVRRSCAYTLLHLLAYYNRVQMATYLMERCTAELANLTQQQQQQQEQQMLSVNIRAVASRHNSTPLHEAAAEGHEEMVQWLLRKGADVNAGGQYNATPLHWAARFGHSGTVQLLVQAGANINASFGYGTTALDLAIERVSDTTAHSSLLIVTLLLQRGAAVNYRSETTTPLHRACRIKDSRILQLLLQVPGIDLTMTSRIGETALHLAARDGNKTAVQLLIQHSQLQQQQQQQQQHTQQQHTQQQQFLTRDSNEMHSSEEDLHHVHDEHHHHRHANVVNIKTEKGGLTALHVTDNVEIAQLLVENGADINAVSDDGRSPLQLHRADVRNQALQPYRRVRKLALMEYLELIESYRVRLHLYTSLLVKTVDTTDDSSNSNANTNISNNRARKTKVTSLVTDTSRTTRGGVPVGIWPSVLVQSTEDRRTERAGPCLIFLCLRRVLPTWEITDQDTIEDAV